MKVSNSTVFPSADKTICLENYNGNRVITIRVSYWDYLNDYNILDYKVISIKGKVPKPWSAP